MATNSWNALAADVNGKLSEMNTAISGANGAASTARNAAESADSAAERAHAAADGAEDAARAAEAEQAKWSGATAQAETLPAGEAAAVTITENGGVKQFTFRIPRGADGAQGEKGEKGDTGRSGVTFTLSGTTLGITTN